MIENVKVIVRYTGERTLDACLSLLSKQVHASCVEIIEEKPFWRAVKRTFELGIEHGKAWTLAVDADILLHSSAVEKLIGQATGLPDNFFCIQGRVLDKLLCHPRVGGPHLYRTSLLQKAYDLIQELPDLHRPESKTVKRMVAAGYHSFDGLHVFGLHDFEQYYTDIFRKSFAHARKHAYLLSKVMPAWLGSSAHDPDYHIALLGMVEGNRNPENTSPEKIRALAESYLSALNMQEKNKISNFNIDVNRIMAEHSMPPGLQQLEKQIYRRDKRSDKPYEKPAWKELMASVGPFVEKVGRRFKSWGE